MPTAPSAIEDTRTDEEKKADEIAKKKIKNAFDEQQDFGQQAEQGHLHFGEPAYWEARYADEFAQGFSRFDLFDWYCSFDLVYPMIDSIIDMTIQQRILLVGIGRSNTLEYLYSRGHRSITCIDVSSTLIAKMSQRYSDFHGVDFLCMDAKELTPFSDKSFSLVIDKGTMDSIFCGTEFRNDSKKYFDEIYRVLEDEGTFLAISHAAPLTRVPYLRQTRWAVDTTNLPEGESLTMYVLTRTENEALLNRKVAGGEAALPTQRAKVTSKLDQTANKNSTTKQPGGGGGLTITADADFISSLVEESEEND